MSGLVVCAVVAATVHADVATGAILATVLMVALAATFRILRAG